MYGCVPVHRHFFFSPFLLISPLPHPSPSSSLLSLSTSSPYPSPSTSNKNKNMKVMDSFSLLILFFFFFFFLSVYSVSALHSLLPSKCDEKCGNLHIPFPFHLTNSTCGLHPSAFRLSCSSTNSTSLSLPFSPFSFPVLDLSSDSLILDLPGVSSCRRYLDLDSFPFSSNPFFGVSPDNLIRLYDCDDSSVCKVDCEQFDFEGCEGNDSFRSSCCYPLSDRSVWRFGEGFSVFGEFGCRGFSSWVVAPGTSSARRGIKLEWAVPRNYSDRICADDAVFINASAVRGGGRCVCGSGFVGDGFAEGIGCFQSCLKDGDIAYGSDCHNNERHSKKKVGVLAGVIISAIVLAALVICYALLRHPFKANRWDPAHLPSVIAFRKACKIRLFSYSDLEEATKGFHESQKLVDGIDGTVHAGMLDDGSLVAVQKIQCESEQDLMRVLMRLENLYAVTHKNVARLLGCCIDSGSMLLVVYEFFANGTLDEYLQRERGKCLDWYQRMNIAIETANALAYLQFDISPPVFHHDLKSSDIFFDHDYSVKVAGFWRFKPGCDDGFSSYNVFQGSHQQLLGKSDVYSFGMILMEIITGSKHVDLASLALPKIRDGRLDEIVDPVLCYRDQLFQREQIGRVAGLAARCLSFGGDGRLSMVGVSMELMQIMKENVDSRRKGAALEETFSTSSLLQMISMSPDTLYAPCTGA
ncbi:putative inactive receptor-like protein kinase [Cinnamomum micranthum f. kanehirae]|uniref:Putative inactive receptor-like protein kinase n=1 Tax=Cinnamomum micranthum f. kanehirae TaxID=337451 RepID=A0A443PFH7_9MAGN|nr:putative inactive receptor-like protein kinase [Cinnamomum micranthum f. kanehirae]